jgi:hypothetical protein
MKMTHQISSTEHRVSAKFCCPNCKTDLYRLRHLCFQDEPVLLEIIDAYLEGRIKTIKLTGDEPHKYVKMRFREKSAGITECYDDEYTDEKEYKSCNFTCGLPIHTPGDPAYEAEEERKLASTRKCQPRFFDEYGNRIPHGLLGLDWRHLPVGTKVTCDCFYCTTLHRPDKCRDGIAYVNDFLRKRETVLKEAGLAQAGQAKTRRRRLPRPKSMHLPRNFASAIETKCRFEPGINHPRPHQQKWQRYLLNAPAGVNNLPITPLLITTADAQDWAVVGGNLRYGVVRFLRGRVWMSAMSDPAAPYLLSQTVITVNTVQLSPGPAQLQLTTDNRAQTIGHFGRPLSWVWSKVDQSRTLNATSVVTLFNIATDANFPGGEIVIDVEFVGVD